MDANGHRFFQLARPGDFDLSDGSCQWSGDCLHLSGHVALPELQNARGEAVNASKLPPVTVGRFGDWAWVDTRTPPAGLAGRVMGASEGGDPGVLLEIPEGGEVHDLSVDEDGILRLAADMGDGRAGVLLADLRRRWADPVVLNGGAQPTRVAGQWSLQMSTGRLWREAGIPLPDLAQRSYADYVFRPDPEYTNPPRLEEQTRVSRSSSRRILDCAVREDGLLAVLLISPTSQRRSFITFVTPRGEQRRLQIPLRGFASSIGFVGPRHVAVTYPGLPRAVVLDLGGDDPQALSVEPNHTPLPLGGTVRLTRGAAMPVSACAYENDVPGDPQPLRSLSRPSYRSQGRAAAIQPIVSEAVGTVWHRLAVEGDFPKGTGAVITVQAAEAQAGLDEAPVHRHYLGEVDIPPDAPELSWIDAPSELPLGQSILSKTRQKNRRGCFAGLVQSQGRELREVAGRFAKITVELVGKGQLSPQVAAVRLYGDRFSLVRNYMPAVMHPPSDPALRDSEGAARPMDYYDRLTALFEAQLTRIEDSVAAAPDLTNPLAAPPEALDWLAGWIGLSLHPGFTETQRRAMLTHGMALHRQRGTLQGLMLALDIASEGLVSGGSIVAIEDFRMRQVIATILGADLGDSYDPMLAGPVESGNSFVGPTLHLGPEPITLWGRDYFTLEQITELTALYGGNTKSDFLKDRVRNWYHEKAWALTLLLHRDLSDDRRALLEEVARTMLPAHVKLTVSRASHPLIIGLYGLLGLDTALKSRPPTEPVVVSETLLGANGHVQAQPHLDPRFDDGGAL